MGWKAPVDCNGRRCFPFLPFMASENSGRERAGERTPLKNGQAACGYGLLCFPGGLSSVPLFVTTPFRFENRQGPPQFLRRAPACRETPGVDKGPQPLMLHPALTTSASERMKTRRFSYFAGFAARERMREAKPVKLKKVAFSHFFDTLRPAAVSAAGLLFFPGCQFIVA